MFGITISTTFTTLIVAVTVLMGITISNDTTESTKWFKHALIWNTYSQIVILVTYFFCSQNTYTLDDVYTNLVNYRWFVLRDFADIAAIPIISCINMYLGTLTISDAKFYDTIKRNEKMLNIKSWVLGILIVGYIGFRLLFGYYDIFDSLVYIVIYIILVNALMLDVYAVLKYKRHIGNKRAYCILIYMLVQLLCLTAVWISEESSFYQANVIVLIFLIFAMQTEQVQEGNIKVKVSEKVIEKERRLLSEMTTIYESMHVINLAEGSYREIGAAPERAQHIIDRFDRNGIQKTLWGVMERVVSPAYIKDAKTFTDLSTLDKRMKDRKIITLEAIDDLDQWFRFSFFKIDTSSNGRIREVVFTSENINENVREKEYLKSVSFADALTGVYNRNAYSAHMEEYKALSYADNLWIMAIDINGLKITNDTLGHEAGDEIIKGTAWCLKNAIGSNGNLYRIGGDEFVAFVEATVDEINEMKEKLTLAQQEWHGNMVDSMSFSVGIVRAIDYPEMKCSQIVAEADRRMYEEKKLYYDEHKELDRRITDK